MFEAASINNHGHSLGVYTTILSLAIIFILLIILIGIFCHYMAKTLIMVIQKIFKTKKHNLMNLMYEQHLIQRIAYLIPAFVLSSYTYLFDINTSTFKLYLASIVSLFTNIYIIFNTTLILSSILNIFHEKYKNLSVAKTTPIKSYVQVTKIILLLLAIILVISLISQKSPTYIMTGLGALAAVLLLVFKDSILGFVASIQLAAYDMVHIGDNIEMSSYGADGEVIDISLNTVKVQNSDKSIVTIPSYALLTSGMKNWRGMKEAGGRRVKRAINIDIRTIKICDQALLENLSKLNLFKEKLQEKITGINTYNKKNQIDTSLLANGKYFTNMAAFRYYLEIYLRNQPGIHKRMRIAVRELQATINGIPLELYFFTNNTNADIYEAIQADVMDHIYGILSTFELRMFQMSSDN